MLKRIDHIAAGLIIGICMPVITLFVYYAFTYRAQTTFSGFIEYFSRLHIIVQSMSLAVYASNLPLFFLFIWKECNKAARGMLIATILYTLWVMYEKFLG
jgi:hypothetical protein